jgi:hypothetical protein
MKTKKDDLPHSENKIQSDCFQWFHNSFKHLRGLLFHVPNGEYRDMATANRLKAMGVVPGIPDLIFNYRGRTYFIEMKKPGGKPSKEQIKIHDILDQHRFTVWIVDSLEGFKKLINIIIGDTSEQFTQGLKMDDYFYRHKVYNYLYTLTDGELIEVAEVCNEETEQKFINFVSEFITEGFPQLEGFNILFTPDYKAFYRKDKGSEKEIIYKGKNCI